MGHSRPDERRLRTAVLHVARVYLEVERGLRSPDHLARILARREYQRHRREPMETRHPGTGPVVPDDIGQMHLDRSVPGQVTASVNTREAGDRWGALTIHFRQRREGWVVDHLQRLPRRGLQAVQKPTTVSPDGFADRVRQVEEELRMARSARRGVQARLDDLLAGGDSGFPEPLSESQLRDQVGRWSDQEVELGRELIALDRRRQLHERLGLSPAVPEDQPLLEPAADAVTQRLERVLGPRPEDPDGRQLWDAAHEEVRTYRRFWDVDDTRSLLGGQPTVEWQQRHRGHVVDLLRSTATNLHAHQQIIEPGRELDRRRELDRSFGIEP